MESSCNTRDECCVEDDDLKHTEIKNRPGLSSISYRIATHGKFKEIMLSRLDFWMRNVLEGYKRSKNEKMEEERTSPLLRSDNDTIGLVRSDDDLTTALIDCWAVIADILTFYQERIANEGFLRTARERRSIIEMGRTTGYKLRPGLAASTLLAFNLEEAPGIAETAIIDIGTKVQSLPGPNEKAQTFETIEKIEARREWNSLKPRTTFHRRSPINQDLIFVLDSVNSKLKTGDLLLLVSRPDPASRSLETHFRIIDKIEIDLPSQQTTVYTHNQVIPYLTSDASSKSSSENDLQDEMLSEVAIEGKKFSLTDVSESQLEKYAAELKWPKDKLQGFLNSILSKNIISTADYEGLYMFEIKCNVFGHNAPKYRVIPKSQENSGSQDTSQSPQFQFFLPYSKAISTAKEEYWDIYNGKDILINEDSKGGAYIKPKNNKIFLDASYPGILVSSFVVLQNPTSAQGYLVEAIEEKTLADFSLTGKSTGITIHQGNPSQVIDLSQFKLRETTVYAASKKLELAPYEKEFEMEKNDVELDRLVSGFRIGQYVAVTGKTLTTIRGRTEITGSTENEVAEISDIRHVNGYTVLRFKEDLKNRYRRDTVTINANLAKATHGEGKSEVLGAGDPSKKFQEFTIMQKPVTYVSGMSESGTLNSLEVRVNDLLWREVPNLLDVGPSDHVYSVRTDDDKTVHVIFGDGVRGARPRAGKENIKARFRVGIGKEGLLKQDQLSLLMTRPLGVRSVTNPIPTSGADDPESLDMARSNTSLSLLAMGRIVSLKDVQDFARAFAGIGKAQAIWVWDGDKKVVHLTIAPATGLKINESDDLLYKNLIKAIKKSIDPGISVAVHSFNPRFFNIEARVMISPEFLGEKVLEEIRRALLDRFSFESRELGQSVRIDEVINTIQKVDGVQSVDVDKLYDSVDDASLKEHIESSNTKWKDETIIPAECLVINTAYGGIVLKEA